ncbi:restriction endonuclease subunit S, partial [Psittacicella gerlachiana]
MTSKANVVKLSEVASTIKGYKVKLNQINYDGEGYPYIRGYKALGYLYTAPISRYTKHSTRIVEKDTIIISSRGTIGFINLTHVKSALSYGFIGINSKFIPNVLFKYVVEFNLPQLNLVGSGTTFDEINDSHVNDMKLYLPEDFYQGGKSLQVLRNIELLIENNMKLNDNLLNQIKLIYNMWFNQLEFPNENDKPYKSSGGKLEWNELLEREIPKGWKVENLKTNQLCSIIKSGVRPFEKKTFYPTKSVQGCSIVDLGEQILFSDIKKYSMANMKPTQNSVWFSILKDSKKYLFLNQAMIDVIENSILSDGMFGFQCTESSFEYLASYILDPWFEFKKSYLSHGTRFQRINTEDLKQLYILIPDSKTLE